ncbi:oxidoreductase [Paenibacillus harenae]|uniref:oxidoreductase n=1 Tax=Paenibacillus harenae TaxID=306543 RepID=UPI002792621F|nr:alkene reductase [Paenibacillus harenae]MDQ0059883.1 2,4-dienoyl-CoA reductase-like NADH-dependent reductase (Old Yellow Enzyme family) [Paenibacillus harenae]
MDTNRLLEQVKIGRWTLRSRVVMAPMTRSFANDETGEVGPDVVDYYRKRAADGIGLIITEGINPSKRGKGTWGVPGIYTSNQIEAWKKVTEAVHEEGGTIVAQLWHVGRLTHSELTGGLPPQAPSPVLADGLVHRLRKPYEMPVEMTFDDIRDVIDEYRIAARNALLAGFDGVEIHAAHGYLIDQFNSDITNSRTDRYGGNLSERLTFMKELLHAVAEEIGADRTIVRFSERKDDSPAFRWDNPEEAVKAFLRVFEDIGLSIIHPSTPNYTEILADGLTFHQWVRKYWDGIMIGVGNLEPHLAAKAIAEGTIDLAAFGRPLLANPDFVERISTNTRLESYDPSLHLKYLI